MSLLESVHEPVDGARLARTAQFEHAGGVVLVRELHTLRAEEVAELEGVLLLLLILVVTRAYVDAPGLEGAVLGDRARTLQISGG